MFANNRTKLFWSMFILVLSRLDIAALDCVLCSVVLHWVVTGVAKGLLLSIRHFFRSMVSLWTVIAGRDLILVPCQ